MRSQYTCPTCAAHPMEMFFRLEKVPVHQNMLMRTREAAYECERGDIDLGFCASCGFIANMAFDPSLLNYSPEYENSQVFSPVFHDYMQEIASYLVDRYGLNGKTVVEIGCGKGDFLVMLCELGQSRGIGFDPSYVDRTGPTPDSVSFVRDFYSDHYASQQGDLVCCRHTLEHVPRPADLVAKLRTSLDARPGTPVFFEVPSVTWILREVAFWDIFYEHCNYFGPESLARLFMRAGFHGVKVTEAFGGQYLWLEARSKRGGHEPQRADVPQPEEVRDALAYFTASWQSKMRATGAQFEDASRLGQRCVVWGAGAKGTTILNTLGIPITSLEHVVDVNPRKQGMFIAGTGQQIVSPEFLKSYKPDVAFVMNPNYFGEIRETIAGLGITTRLVSI